MIKKVKQQEFVRKAQAIHGDLYDYTRTVYELARNNVEIYCKKCSKVFSQTPDSHINAACGCPYCSLERRIKSQAKSSEKFFDECKELHGNSFDYSRTEYVSSSYKITIYCNKCKVDFIQSPKKHLAGQGCPTCRYDKIRDKLVHTKEKFVALAREVHGEKYCYDNVKYLKSSSPVDIICEEHGVFVQTPNNHLRDRGCPSCAGHGYDQTSEGNFYILKCGDLTKVGISNYSPSVRASRISKSFGAEFEVVDHWKFSDGRSANTLETDILRYLRGKYKQPASKFEGSSECFLSVNLQDLLFNVEQHSKVMTLQ